MPPVAHAFYLGRKGTFTFSNGIANKDVKTVTVNRETAAEADVTTRGSDDEQEFAFVRGNTTIEVVCLDHTCVRGATGTITCTLSPSGPTGPGGVFQVMTIAETQDLDGAVEFTVSFRKTPSATGA
jgi:hypothetical protein